jgi:hypothetical protein
MRTKTLLLAAVLSAAGIASSLAQAVYSVNVVGYINLNLSPGLNLITAQLKGTNQNVNTILGSTTPVLAANSLLFTWNATGQKFDNAQIAGGDNKWYDPVTGTESTTTVNPGQAFFINNVGAAVTMTLVGEVPTFPVTVSVVNGLGFYGDPAPVSQNIVTNGFPVGDNDLLFTWNPTGQTYNNALIGAGPSPGPTGWYDPVSGTLTTVAPAVGQGFVVNRVSGATTTWNRTFTIQ